MQAGQSACVPQIDLILVRNLGKGQGAELQGTHGLGSPSRTPPCHPNHCNANVRPIFAFHLGNQLRELCGKPSLNNSQKDKKLNHFRHPWLSTTGAAIVYETRRQPFGKLFLCRVSHGIRMIPFLFSASSASSASRPSYTVLFPHIACLRPPPPRAGNLLTDRLPASRREQTANAPRSATSAYIPALSRPEVRTSQNGSPFNLHPRCHVRLTSPITQVTHTTGTALSPSGLGSRNRSAHPIHPGRAQIAYHHHGALQPPPRGSSHAV